MDQAQDSQTTTPTPTRPRSRSKRGPLKQFLKLEITTHVVALVANIIAIIGVFLVWKQLQQGNDHQRWANYNQLNLQYADLYQNMPDELEAKHCKHFNQLKGASQRWVRSYFNLYTEEHWLYLEGLIPDAMWTDRIDGGVSVNFISYPAIVEGYEYWKAKNSFTHPPEFIPFVDDKLLRMKSDLEKVWATCKR